MSWTLYANFIVALAVCILYGCIVRQDRRERDSLFIATVEKFIKVGDGCDVQYEAELFFLLTSSMKTSMYCATIWALIALIALVRTINDNVYICMAGLFLAIIALLLGMLEIAINWRIKQKEAVCIL